MIILMRLWSHSGYEKNTIGVHLNAAMNPCPWEWAGMYTLVTTYQKHTTDLLLDRIGIHIGLTRVDYEKRSYD